MRGNGNNGGWLAGGLTGSDGRKITTLENLVADCAHSRTLIKPLAENAP